MSYSIGEIVSLSVKAARGAGKPWGLAEEAGRAVRWLSGQGLPGAEALADALQKTRGYCPITIGAAISDQWSESPLLGRSEIAQPLLILPFLSLIAPLGGAISIRIGDVSALVSREGTDLAEAVPGLASVIVSPADQRPVLTPPRIRVEKIMPDALRILEEYAARTYAPATEASRAKGAGAGLTDND